MKNLYLLPLFISLLALLSACSAPGSDGSQKKRTLKIPYPAIEEQNVLEITKPSLSVEQEIINCSDNPKCHLESINEPYSNQENQYRISSVIFADSDIMVSANIQDAPAISFSLNNIDLSSIISSTLVYTKKDSLGNVIIQTAETQISDIEGEYTVPIHSSIMGSGILISAPYEKHELLIRINTNKSETHNFKIEFFISSNTINPVTIERDIELINTTYYKMDEDLPSFLIDSVIMKNTLPFNISLNGEINLNSTTIAFLTESTKIQQKSFIPETAEYPFDIYNWSTSTNSNYNLASASPMFLVKVEKNGVEEETPTTISYNGNGTTITIEGLEITADSTIKLKIYANMDVNNSILGNHGQKNLFVGKSLCATVNSNSKCNCFFAPTNIHDSSMTALLFYNMASTTMLQIKDLFYPNCGSNVPNGFVTQQLSITSYPNSSIELVGRHHRTDTSYNITTWLKGYEDYEDLGSLSKTMDTIESTKGFYDYAQVNTALGYQGYIPGQF